MRAHLTVTLKALSFLICAHFAATLCLGQSVSISKQNTNFFVHGTPPQDVPSTLQASENFHLWIDVTNDVADPFSVLLENPLVSSRFYRLIPAAPEAPPIRIIALGDSLISDCCGWAAGIYGYLKPNVIFANYAWPGRGSKTTLANSGELQNMLLIKPEYVFFEFGEVDEGTGVTPDEFEANLKTLVNIIRGWNGVPVFITIQPYRLWDASGNFIPWDHPYNPITRRVAVETGSLLIDFNKIATDAYKKLGPAGCAFMTWTGIPNDTIHFSPVGAVWISQLVVKTLPDSFGPYLTEKIFDQAPTQ